MPSNTRLEWSQQVEELRLLLTRIPAREEEGEAFAALAGDVYKGCHRLLAVTRTALIADLSTQEALVADAQPREHA